MTDMNVVENSNPSSALSGLTGASGAGKPAVTGQEGIIQGTMGDFQAQIEALLNGEFSADSVYSIPSVTQTQIQSPNPQDALPTGDVGTIIAATTPDVHFDFNIDNALAALSSEELTALQTNVEQALAATPELDLGNAQATLASLLGLDAQTQTAQAQTSQAQLQSPAASQPINIEQAQNVIDQFGLEGFSPDELVARINGLHTQGMAMNTGHLLPMQAAVTTLPLEQIAQQYGLTVEELTTMSKTPVVGQLAAKMGGAQTAMPIAATEQAIPQDGIAKLQSLIASAKAAAGETSEKSMSQTTVDASTNGEMVSEAKTELSRMRGEAQMLMTENANTRAKTRMAMATTPQNTAQTATAQTAATAPAASSANANKATDTASATTAAPSAQGVGGEAAIVRASFDATGQQFGQQQNNQQGQQQQAWRSPEMLNYTPGTTMPMTDTAFTLPDEAALMEFEMGSFANIAGGMSSLRGETSIMSSQGQTSQAHSQTQTAADQVGLQISKTVAGGNQQFTIKLTPEDLGTVMVKLAFDDAGKVSALVSADSAQALEMLKQDAKTIERAMELSGHKADAGAIEFALHDKEGESAGRAMAEAVQQDKLDAEAENSEQQSQGEMPWSEEEEISLEDILANVSPETGIDVRI